MVSVDSQIIDDLKERGENCINNFTAERISALKQQIKAAYEPGIGIGATVLSRILFGYQQAIYKYEGIAYHFFGLVATKSPENRSKKGSLFFVSINDIGKTEFPVCESVWHNYSESSTVERLERTFNSENSPKWRVVDSSSLSPKSTYSELSSLYSKLSDVCSELSKAYSSLG